MVTFTEASPDHPNLASPEAKPRTGLLLTDPEADAVGPLLRLGQCWGAVSPLSQNQRPTKWPVVLLTPGKAKQGDFPCCHWCSPEGMVCSGGLERRGWQWPGQSGRVLTAAVPKQCIYRVIMCPLWEQMLSSQLPAALPLFGVLSNWTGREVCVVVWQRWPARLVIPGDSMAASLVRPDKALVKILCCQQIEGHGWHARCSSTSWHRQFDRGVITARVNQESGRKLMTAFYLKWVSIFHILFAGCVLTSFRYTVSIRMTLTSDTPTPVFFHPILMGALQF